MGILMKYDWGYFFLNSSLVSYNSYATFNFLIFGSIY